MTTTIVATAVFLVVVIWALGGALFDYWRDKIEAWQCARWERRHHENTDRRSDPPIF